MLRVFIAHHHSLVRHAITDIAYAGGHAAVVGTAEAVPEVLPALRELTERPDCLVLELSLPEGSTLKLVRELRAHAPKLPIATMSVTSDAEHVARALRAGASAYVGNRSGSSDIVEALRALEGEKSYISDELAESLAYRGVFGPKSEPISTLSNREYEVMKLIGEGTPISRIAAELELSVSTVNTHRQRIMRKLQLSSASELMRYAIEQSFSAGRE